MNPALRLLPLSAVLLGLSLPAAAEPPPVSPAEYRLYRDYQAALGDERVLKLPEAKRAAAIAKNFKVSEKDLRAAVERCEQHPELGRRSEEEIRSLIDAGPLQGRLHDLKVDDSDAHVVTFLAWRNEDPDRLEEEAALAAIAAAKGAPVTSTIAVWAVDAATGRKVFEAKIGAAAAGKFNPERVSMFASTRYIRIFEDVRNAYKGNPPADGARTE